MQFVHRSSRTLTPTRISWRPPRAPVPRRSAHGTHVRPRARHAARSPRTPECSLIGTPDADRPGMNLPRFALTSAFVLALAACGGNAGSSSNPSGPGAPGLAQSNLPRKPAAQISQAALDGAVSANNAFAIDLYGRLRTDPAMPAGNLLTSPVSASPCALDGIRRGRGADRHRDGRGAALRQRGKLHVRRAERAEPGPRMAAPPSRSTPAKQSASENQQPAPSADDFQLQVVNSVWGEHTYPWAKPVPRRPGAELRRRRLPRGLRPPGRPRAARHQRLGQHRDGR